MALKLFLTRQTRIFLLKPAIEGGYVFPNSVRTRGLSDFLSDACQKSFARTDTPLTSEQIESYRTNVPSITIVIDPITLRRFMDLYEMFIGSNPRTPYFAVTDVLHAIHYKHIKLTNDIWPSKLDATHVPSRWIPEAYKNVDPVRLKEHDIYEAASYLVSDNSYEQLRQMAVEDGYVKQSIQGKYGKGLTPYLDTLSLSDFIDTRPPADYAYLPTKFQWSNGDKRMPRPLTLSIDCRARFVSLAQEFHIHPAIKNTETAITSSVLEAIGCKFLTPVQRPNFNSHLQHGPTLIPLQENK